MTLGEIRALADNPGQIKQTKHGPGFEASCPVCQDGKSHSRHLLIYEKDDWWHVVCIRGCPEDQILASWGIAEKDRRLAPFVPAEPPKAQRERKAPPPPTDPKILAELEALNCEARKNPHIYDDGKGTVIHKSRRYFWHPDKKKIDKSFDQRVPMIAGKPAKLLDRVSKTGKKYKSLPSPAEAGIAVKPLFRQAEVLAAIAAGKTIHIGEGEKAAEWLEESVGEVATCQIDGAGPGKWRPQHTQTLKGAKRIVIWADRDEVGENYARDVYQECITVCPDVMVVQSKTTGEHDDLYDHLQAGFTVDQFERREDLEKRLDIAERMKALGVVCMADVEAEQVDWLWHPYIPLGYMTLMDADGGVGKTYLACALATSISRGHLPDGSNLPDGRRNVVMFMHEDVPGTIKTRLENCGANCEHIFVMTENFRMNKPGLDRIEEVIRLFNPVLLVFDPIYAYWAEGYQTNKTEDVTPAMGPLDDLGRKYRLGILNIRHTGKGDKDRESHHAGLGSVTMRNMHRSQLVIRKHKERPAIRVIEHLKYNHSAQGDNLSYEIDEDRFYWRIGEHYLPESDDSRERAGAKLQRAKGMIRELCRRVYQTRPALEAAAKNRELSPATLRRAIDAMTESGELEAFRPQTVNRDHWSYRLVENQNP